MSVSETIEQLAKRWFVLCDVHRPGAALLLHPRHAISWMRGPLTRVELRRALAAAR